MKRFVAIGLVLIILVAAFVSCGGEPIESEQTTEYDETTEIITNDNTSAVTTDSPDKPVDLKSSWISRIAELSTVRTSIHFTGKGDVSNKIIWGAITVGTDTAYFQYDAEFDVGVKIGNVKIDKENKTVKVEMTGPQLLSLKIDEASIDKYPIVIIGSDSIIKDSDMISATEKNKMMGEAKQILENKIKEEETNFDIALQNAKELIDNYVNIISEGTYTIEYIIK